jgi:rSAM/selenodomain-associated transferase 2
LKISVVIPVVNEAAIIASAIDRAWETGADQVIVVDGGSTDTTIDQCQSLRCQLVHSPAGRGTQLNAGAAVATGDLLLFLHADNWLATGGGQQIRSAANQLNDLAKFFGGFRQRIQSDRSVFRIIELGNALRLRWRGLVYGDQAFFISRKLFEKQGGFPAIPLMEDLAFSRRLKSLAKPMILDGPTYVSVRRWEKNGPIRQTLLNWYLSTSFMLGATPEWLAKKYRRHDAPKIEADFDKL